MNCSKLIINTPQWHPPEPCLLSNDDDDVKWLTDKGACCVVLIPKGILSEVLNIAKLVHSADVATGGVPEKKLLLKIMQISQENNCVGVSFK